MDGGFLAAGGSVFWAESCHLTQRFANRQSYALSQRQISAPPPSEMPTIGNLYYFRIDDHPEIMVHQYWNKLLSAPNHFRAESGVVWLDTHQPPVAESPVQVIRSPSSRDKLTDLRYGRYAARNQ
jgi:hypothetical protein